MTASKQSSPALASASGGNFAGNAAGNAPVARIVTRAPASRVGMRHYTPKELSAALAEAGIALSERSIMRRCGLPEGDALRIATPPAFPGRHYLPETELVRLLGVSEAVA